MTKDTTPKTVSGNPGEPKTDSESGVSKIDPLEEHMPHLDDNDVWFYQVVLEGMTRRALPDNMNAKYMQMLRILCAQARRAAQYEAELKRGEYPGLRRG